MGCGTLSGDGLTKYIQNDANIYETQNLVECNRLEIKNETEDQDQSIPKSIGTLTVLRCILVQIWKASLYLVLTYRPGNFTSPKWGEF